MLPCLGTEALDLDLVVDIWRDRERVFFQLVGRTQLLALGYVLLGVEREHGVVGKTRHVCCVFWGSIVVRVYVVEVVLCEDVIRSRRHGITGSRSHFCFTLR